MRYFCIGILAFSVINIAMAQDVVSKYLSGDIPLNPTSKIWQNASFTKIPLSGQAIVTPMDLNPATKSIEVKSLNNGRYIAFLLSWKDNKPSYWRLNDAFSDAVALEVPLIPDSSTPITMGGNGKEVIILQWAAYRQNNLQNGYADLPRIEPNYYSDYWYPQAKIPYSYPKDWNNRYALDYVGGRVPYWKNTRDSSVIEFIADGYTTTTWKKHQEAKGLGVYKDGRWYVEIIRPFKVKDTTNPEWGPGVKTFIDFAVWQGSYGERDSRKAISYAWIPLIIEGK
ncbi:MAG: ethylbenzene dehydrogenase-related protein [Thermoproteota archaeon]